MRSIERSMCEVVWLHFVRRLALRSTSVSLESRFGNRPASWGQKVRWPIFSTNSAGNRRVSVNRTGLKTPNDRMGGPRGPQTKFRRGSDCDRRRHCFSKQIEQKTFATKHDSRALSTGGGRTFSSAHVGDGVRRFQPEGIPAFGLEGGAVGSAALRAALGIAVRPAISFDVGKRVGVRLHGRVDARFGGPVRLASGGRHAGGFGLCVLFDGSAGNEHHASLGSTAFAVDPQSGWQRESRPDFLRVAKTADRRYAHVDQYLSALDRPVVVAGGENQAWTFGLAVSRRRPFGRWPGATAAFRRRQFGNARGFGGIGLNRGSHAWFESTEGHSAQLDRRTFFVGRDHCSNVRDCFRRPNQGTLRRHCDRVDAAGGRCLGDRWPNAHDAGLYLSGSFQSRRRGIDASCLRICLRRHLLGSPARWRDSVGNSIGARTNGLVAGVGRSHAAALDRQ